MFEKCSLIRVDESRFQLQFVEDFNRLYAILALWRRRNLPQYTNGALANLLLFLSSRSISASIINSIEGQIQEYTFLQLYQCLEYLFILNNGFEISKKHHIPKKVSVDIVSKNNLKISEEASLIHLFRDNIETDKMQLFYDNFSQKSSTPHDTFKWAATYIYRIRCCIAHLRYNQDNTLRDLAWDKLIAITSDIILSAYQKLDTEIIEICMAKNIWTPVMYTIHGE